jgi:hypothetical protein
VAISTFALGARGVGWSLGERSFWLAARAAAGEMTLVSTCWSSSVDGKLDGSR